MTEQDNIKPSGSEPTKPARFYHHPLFRWVVTILFVALILSRIDLGAVSEALGRANGWWVLAALSVMVTEQVLITLFWRHMLWSKGYRAPILPMLQINFVANFIGFAIPSAAGPDVSRVIGLSRYIKSVSEAFSSLLIMRLFSQATLFTIAFFSLIFFRDRLPANDHLVVLGYFLGAGMVGVYILILLSGPAFNGLHAVAKKFNIKEIYQRLERFHKAYTNFIRLPQAIGAAFLSGVVIQANGIIVAYLLSHAIGLDIDFVTFLIFIPVISAITKIPVTIGGVGLREGSFAFFFSYAGVATGESVALSLLVFANILIITAIGGIIFWLFGVPAGKSLEDFKAQTRINQTL